MANGKNRIVIYRDWINVFEALSDEEAGRLIKHLFRYVNDLNPEAPDRLTGLLFEPIKQTLKRDLKAYEAICLKNKDNIDKRWNGKNTPVYDRIRPDTKNTDSDIDNDIDKKDKIITWRESFGVYLAECKKAYAEFWKNDELIKQQQRLHPGVNVKISIEKGFTNFWSTQSGWRHKKKSKTKEIDWEATIKNSIDLNKVYYTKEELAKR